MASVTLTVGEPRIPLPAAMLPLRDTLVATPARLSIWHVFAITSVVWLIMRIVFFVGFVGSDDMYYVRFAAMWDRAPANHWESRLLFNAMTRLSMELFGRGEWAAVLPCLTASFACVMCVVVAANRWLSESHAMWAGLLAATLPIDVEGGTTVSAYALMTAFVLTGTLASLKRDQTRTFFTFALVSFALGVLAHRIAVFYIGAFALTLFVCDRSMRRVAGQALLTTMAALFFEHIYCWIVYHDFSLPFRTALGQAQSENPEAPLLIHGVLNYDFFTWPIVNLVASKAFGLTFLVAAIGLWCARGTLRKELVILLFGGCIFWSWMNFGSQIPWEYRPFWRMTRFWYPLMLPATLLASVAIMKIRLRGGALLFGAGLVACHLLALMSSGSWNQNAKISRELLAYVKQYTGMQFVTDYHTLNEMYVANGVTTVENVVTTDEIGRWKLLDPKVRQIGVNEIDTCAGLLINPLNVAREPNFAAISERVGGELHWESGVELRSICTVVPFLANADWAVKKPAAIVRTIMREGRITSVRGVACDDAQLSPYTDK